MQRDANLASACETQRASQLTQSAESEIGSRVLANRLTNASISWNGSVRRISKMPKPGAFDL